MGQNLTNLPISASFQYLVQISGSDQVTDGTGSLISSLDINATSATTATNATSASFATNANTANTATSASFATTASFALNAPAATDTGSLLTTASISDATITFTKGDASTFDIEVNNVTTANTASYVAGANVDGTVANATSASHADNASTADSATSASHADNASTADSATTATTASHADIAADLVSGANININTITASEASFTSASIGYLQAITGSAKIIGDAFIILNNDTPTERYAGVKVQDSGSTNATASLLFDGQTNDWFYQYSGSDDTDYGVVMFGPEYDTQGSPTYLSNNTIPKGNGGHHLNDSSITDDGTDVTVNANISASGLISASTYYGDGSNLSGITTDPFPYTGSAIISGSLEVTGSVDVVTTVGETIIMASDHLGSSSIDVGPDNRGNVIIGGSNSRITGSGITQYNTLIGARRTVITSNGNTSTFALGASDGDIQGNINYAGLIGGTANTVSHNRSVVIGSSDLASSRDDEVTVNNLLVSGTAIVRYQPLIEQGDGFTGSLIDNIVPTASIGNTQIAHIVNLTQDDYDNLSSYSDDTMYVISDTTGSFVSGSLRGNVEALTISSATASMNCELGNFFTLTLSGSVHLEATNIKKGQTISLRTTQGSPDTGSLTFSDSFKFKEGNAPTFTSGTGSEDLLSFLTFDASNLYGAVINDFQ